MLFFWDWCNYVQACFGASIVPLWLLPVWSNLITWTCWWRCPSLMSVISHWFDLHFALPVEIGYGGFLTLYMWDRPQQDYFRISDDRSWLGIALSVSRMSCRELCEVAAHSFGVFSYWSPSWDLSEGLWVFGLASVAMPCSCTRSCREELLLGHLLKYSH